MGLEIHFGLVPNSDFLQKVSVLHKDRCLKIFLVSANFDSC